MTLPQITGSVRVPDTRVLWQSVHSLHAVQIVFAVVWVAFWLYWLVGSLFHEEGPDSLVSVRRKQGQRSS